MFSVRCEDFSPSAGVTTSITTDGSETQLLFTCGLSYSLGGTSVAKCLPNGTWDIPATPKCGRWPWIPGLVFTKIHSENWREYI